MFLPRIGFAYALTAKTTLRGGYGVYYDTLNAQNQSPDQSGFSLTTTNSSSNDFGQTWLSGDPRAGVSPLTNPFPLRSDGTRFDPPVGSALGLLARDGNGWTFLDPNFQRAREQRWRLELQRQFGEKMVLSVAYAGMYASNVRLTRKLDALPAQYWNFGNTRNNTIATNLNQNVTNPFYIANFSSLQASDPVIYQSLASRSFFTSPTIRKNQLLRPFSQMNSLSETGGYGETKGESVEVVFTRRFAGGLHGEWEFYRTRRARSRFLLSRVRSHAELGVEQQRHTVAIYDHGHLGTALRQDQVAGTQRGLERIVRRVAGGRGL